MTNENVEPSPDSGPLWSPNPLNAESLAMHRFADEVGIPRSYEALHEWSVANPGDFWSAVWDFAGIAGDRGDQAMAPPPPDSALPLIDTRFFPDAQLSVVENLLWGGGAQPADIAIVTTDETGRRRELTRGALARNVAAFAGYLSEVGVEAGDRVAAWMPNTAETVVAMLGAASLGAVFSSTSPDFGVEGVVDRFGQIEPKVLIAADGYYYGGKTHDCFGRLAEIVDRLPTVTSVVVVPNLDVELPRLRPGWVAWSDALSPYRQAVGPQRFGFDHPWYILYSSGTTGVPKCIVHRTGGLLLQHQKEHTLHSDIGPGDRVFFYTTCGWMMWNWLVSALAVGATIYCYDGSPFHPGPDVLLKLAEREQLTFFGISAKYLDSLRNEGYIPEDHHDLSSIRTVASTGSPLVAESFEWFYQRFSESAHLASITGGTDLCSCFMLGDPSSPVYAGEIQRAGLGMDVHVLSSDGQDAGVDERGELTCRAPFPSMPIEFWADAGRQRLTAAYFEDDPEVWNHGDFVSQTAHGGYVVHGRSDTTLNPGGVRIGTAEIYRRVERIEEIVESLVFGQQLDGDVRIVLLVRLTPQTELSDELQQEIRTAIRTGCTPRHVPGLIVQVDDLPRTRSGKLAELAVGDAVAGREVRNTTALANPETLEVIAAAVHSAG